MKLTFIIRKEIMKPLNKSYEGTSNFYLDPDYFFLLVDHKIIES